MAKTRKKTLHLTTNKALRDFFRVYNHMHFGGRLSENVTVSFGQTPKKDAAYVDIRGVGDDMVGEIVIDERLRGMDCVVAWLIVHEQAHMDIDGDDDGKHDGPKHNKRMMELARAGALEGIW